MNIRQPAVAGAFYPADPQELKDQIVNFLTACRRQPDLAGKNLRALISPHAGYIYSGIVAAAGYRLLKNHSFDTVILIGPSHQLPVTEPFTPQANGWQTPLGEIEINQNLISKLKVKKDDLAHVFEHSLEVQLPFLQVLLKNFKIAPIVINEEDLGFSRHLAQLADQNHFLVASSDLSHYYPYETAVKIDSLANRAIVALDLETVRNRVEACGKAGILTLMEIAKQKKWRGGLVDYQNSGDTAGDKSQVVGYGSYVFWES